MNNNIEANLKFIVPQDAKPFFESSAYTGTVPKIYFKTEYKSVTILDIRDNKESYSLAQHGFQLLNHKSNVRNSYSAGISYLISNTISLQSTYKYYSWTYGTEKENYNQFSLGISIIVF